MSRTAFMFSGQGAQFVGMGKELYETSAAAKAVFDMGEAIRPGTLDMCFEGPGEELTKTVNTQPCLFLVDLAWARAFEERGILADMCAGFSLGEIPALAFSGILSDEDAFRLVIERGKAMDECAERNPGGMAAILKLSDEQVEEITLRFNNIRPVNYNCPGQLVCAGANDEMDAFCEAVKEAKGRAAKLAVSGAFHTPFMADAADVLRREFSSMSIAPMKVLLYANKTGEVYPSAEEDVIEVVSTQLCNPVYWEKTIRNMYASGARRFVEAGAGTTLSGLIKRMGFEEEVEVINSETKMA